MKESSNFCKVDFATSENLQKVDEINLCNYPDISNDI